MQLWQWPGVSLWASRLTLGVMGEAAAMAVARAEGQLTAGWDGWLVIIMASLAAQVAALG